MPSVYTMDSSENRPYQGENRRHALSFSLAIRSQIGKRRSFVRPSSPPPTCEERVHYPVFDPQDPRHNPPADAPSWPPDGYYMAQPSNTRDSVRWMQSLPGRSLRKARSGFLALRSGMQKHQPTRGHRRRGDITGIWPPSDLSESSSDLQEDDFPSTISEASTEEDFDFGTGLYRTPCNCSSALVGEPGSYLLSSRRCSVTLAGPGYLPELDMESSSSSGSSSEPTPSSSGEGIVLEHQVIEALSGEPSSLVPRDDSRVSETSSNGDTSSSTSSSSSGSCGMSNRPQIGASPSAEPLQVAHQSHASSIVECFAIASKLLSDSSPSCSKSSRDASPEPADPAQTAQPTEPVNVIDSAYNREELQVADLSNNNQEEAGVEVADDNSTGILSRLSYRPDLLEAWVYNHSSQQDDGASVSRSSRSNSQSEGETTTAPTSVSNSNIRTSLDANLMSLASASVRDEYFLVDKANHPRDDGEDNIVKTGSVTSDGSVHFNQHLDRRSSARDELVCEIVGPGAPPVIMISPAPDAEIRRDSSEDSTDDYLATYSMWQRYYG